MSERSASGVMRDPEKNYRAAHDPSRVAASEDNIIISAWITAFVIPIIGFVLGVILTTRQREAHGILTMVVSTAMAFVWWGVTVMINSPHYRY